MGHGCIIFSQYYDTANWIGSQLAKTLSDEPVAVYAGAGKSGLFYGADFANIDLPWNPSRLEQRLGRIKRIGQARRTVDMLNLVYHDTQDERIYSVLSHRMKDRYDIFGGLPDTIEDDWIESAERLEEMMD